MIKFIFLALSLLVWIVGGVWSYTIDTPTFPATLMYFSYTTWAILVILMAFIFSNKKLDTDKEI